MCTKSLKLALAAKRASDRTFLERKKEESERLNGIKRLPLGLAAHHAVAVRFFILQSLFMLSFSRKYSGLVLECA